MDKFFIPKSKNWTALKSQIVKHCIFLVHSMNSKLNSCFKSVLPGPGCLVKGNWGRQFEIYMGYKCLYGPWFSFYLIRCSPFQWAVRLWRAKISIFSYKSGYFELFITHYLRIIHQKRNQANGLFVRFLKMLKFLRWKHFYKGDLSKWTILTNIGTVSSIFKFHGFTFCQKTSFKIVVNSSSSPLHKPSNFRNFRMGC